MNKIFKAISLLLITSFISFSFTGCYGPFKLTKKLYKWNGTVGDKWVNSAVTWILLIVPVYEIAGFIDFAILNVIQFWSGKNPMAMEEGEKDTQLVELDGIEYEVTATKNRFDIKSTASDGKSISLIYNDETHSWLVDDKNVGEFKVAQLDPANLNLLKLIHPDGQMLVDLESDQIISE